MDEKWNQMFRNVPGRRPIDKRMLETHRLWETENGWKVTFIVQTEKLLDNTLTYENRNLRSDERAEEFHLVSEFYDFLDLIDRRSFLVDQNLDFEIEIRKLTDTSFNFELEQYFAYHEDVSMFDEITLTFTKTSPQMNLLVSIEVVEAWDKEIQRELSAIIQQAEEEQKNSVWWLKLEWLIGRVLNVTKIMCQYNQNGPACIDFAPLDTFYETTVFIQWEWVDEQTLELEGVGKRHAVPKISTEQEAALQGLGWKSYLETPEQDNENYTIRITNTGIQDIAKLIVKTLQIGYRCQSLDLVVIRPSEVSELVIDIPQETRHQEWCYPQGLLYPEDLDLLYSFHQELG